MTRDTKDPSLTTELLDVAVAFEEAQRTGDLTGVLLARDWLAEVLRSLNEEIAKAETGPLADAWIEARRKYNAHRARGARPVEEPRRVSILN